MSLRALGNFPNHILAAEWVGNSNGAGGVILPFAIHQKAVVVLAWVQPDSGLPYSVRVALEVDWLFLPVGEVTNQLTLNASGA